jgi:hypothetical protein
MNLCGRIIVPFLLVSLCLPAVATLSPAQVTNGEKPGNPTGASPSAEAEALQKKANEAQTRVRENEEELGQLKRAVKLNQVDLAKEVLLRNGFTSKDLENAKIRLLTGGGKGGEDTITISATCCEPKEITIQRTLPNFTK